MVWFDAFVILALAITSTIVTVSDNVSDIERDARALEIYIQDRKDHEEHCPSIQWDQPALETYKEKLVSQLPEGCK
tara:strand:+ start:4850 stop:5077 length:228 start_codon:yes stop_codon:yes gene_type:complete